MTKSGVHGLSAASRGEPDIEGPLRGDVKPQSVWNLKRIVYVVKERFLKSYPTNFQLAANFPVLPQPWRFFSGWQIQPPPRSQSAALTFKMHIVKAQSRRNSFRIRNFNVKTNTLGREKEFFRSPPPTPDLTLRAETQNLAKLERGLFFFFSFLFFLIAAPVAYGSSQPRDRIRAAAAGLHHSHSHARSLTH